MLVREDRSPLVIGVTPRSRSANLENTISPDFWSNITYTASMLQSRPRCSVFIKKKIAPTLNIAAKRNVYLRFLFLFAFCPLVNFRIPGALSFFLGRSLYLSFGTTFRGWPNQIV